MRASLACALVVALTPATLAEAAEPPGRPALRVATAADQADHPSVYYEWWSLRMLDPRSKAMVELRFLRHPDFSGLEIRRRGADGEDALPEGAGIRGTVSASSRTVRFAGPAGRAAVTTGRRGWSADVATPGLSGRLALRGARAGPAALAARLGEAVRDPPIRPRLSLSWAMPVARSTVRGALDVQGTALRLDGWRATYEHGWGQFVPHDGAYDWLTTWTVHDRGGTWVAFGLNRTDMWTGPGARDAMWLGVLARVGRRGTRVCRPRIHRRGWEVPYPISIPDYATHLEARCRGMRAAFAGDLGLQRERSLLQSWEADSPATAGGRGDGWVIHRSP